MGNTDKRVEPGTSKPYLDGFSPTGFVRSSSKIRDAYNRLDRGAHSKILTWHPQAKFDPWH